RGHESADHVGSDRRRHRPAGGGRRSDRQAAGGHRLPLSPTAATSWFPVESDLDMKPDHDLPSGMHTRRKFLFGAGAAAVAAGLAACGSAGSATDQVTEDEVGGNDDLPVQTSQPEAP